MRLLLSYPVTPVHVNQPFGVNGEYYRTNGINIKGHNGIDFQAYHGQPVYAAHDGTAFFEYDKNQGEGVVIISDKAYDYRGVQVHFKTVYWHLCDAKKEPQYTSPVYNTNGITVKRGDLIGFADNTGFSAGDHLHFALKPVTAGRAIIEDAADFGVGDWQNLEPNNGYTGGIDPSPYFERPDATSVSYETALTNLMASGLSGPVLWMAQAILKAKYRR